MKAILLSAFFCSLPLAATVSHETPSSDASTRYRTEAALPAIPNVPDLKPRGPEGLFQVRNERGESDKEVISADAITVNGNGDFEITLKKKGQKNQVTKDDDGLVVASLTLMSLLNQVKSEDWKKSNGKEVQGWKDSKDILVRAFKKAQKLYGDKYLPFFIKKLEGFDEWKLAQAQGLMVTVKAKLAEAQKAFKDAQDKNLDEEVQGERLALIGRIKKFQTEHQAEIDKLAATVKAAGGPSEEYLDLLKSAKYAYDTSDLLYDTANKIEKMTKAPTYAELGTLAGKPLNRIYNGPPKEADIKVNMRHGYGTTVDDKTVKMAFGNLKGGEELYLKELLGAQAGDFTEPIQSKDLAFNFTPAIEVKRPAGRPPILPSGGIEWEGRFERPYPLEDKK